MTEREAAEAERLGLTAIVRDLEARHGVTDHLARSEMFRRMVATSTDPQFIREQLGQPHQFSKTFIIALWIIGFLAMWGIFTAAASI